MSKKLVFAFILVLFALQGMPQGRLPDWYYRPPQPSSDSFRYVVATGSGQTIEEAKNQAYADVFRQAAMINRIRFDSEEVFEALRNGKDYMTISTTYDIAMAKVCEHVDDKSSRVKVYFLFQVATSHAVSSRLFDNYVCPESMGSVVGSDALYVDGFSVYQNGRELSDAKLRTIFAGSRSYKYYDAALRCERVSNDKVVFWLGVISGCVSVAVGLPVTATSNYRIDRINSEQDKRQFYTGVGIMATGGALFLTGMCWKPMMRMIGKANIRKAVKLYNNGKMYSQSELEMEFGLIGSSAYFTLSF